MSDRPTPLESNLARCTIKELEGDQIELDGLKNDFDTFMAYRSQFDRAQMIYLMGRIMHRVTNFFAPFLCDIGVSMHHETLSDEEYLTLLNSLREAQSPTPPGGENNGDANTDAGQAEDDPQGIRREA